MRKKNKLTGFTLVEILVSVAIIGILMSLSVISTTRVRLKSRDAKRISNTKEIVAALEAYYNANKGYPDMIYPGQPISSNGLEYLSAVPSNPFPRTDSGCPDQDYTYLKTASGYKLTICIGSDNGRFAKGEVICKNGNCGLKDDCSGEIFDDEDIRYPIVEIGDQCWMAMHLKSKKRPNGLCINIEKGGYSVNADCMTVYTYNNQTHTYGGFGGCPGSCVPIGSRRDCIKTTLPINGPYVDFGWNDRGFDVLSSSYDYPPVSTVSACNSRGALYTWAGAMNVTDDSPDCNIQSCAHLIATPHQGICPQNWHIPTDQEFYTLENFLKDSSYTCDASRSSYVSGDCRDAGSQLVQLNGFAAILLGVREGYSGDEFQKINEEVRFWTTTESASGINAIVRTLKVGDPGVYRHYVEKRTSAAVRCIRDF